MAITDAAHPDVSRHLLELLVELLEETGEVMRCALIELREAQRYLLGADTNSSLGQL